MHVEKFQRKQYSESFELFAMFVHLYIYIYNQAFTACIAPASSWPPPQRTWPNPSGDLRHYRNLHCKVQTPVPTSHFYHQLIGPAKGKSNRMHHLSPPLHGGHEPINICSKMESGIVQVVLWTSVDGITIANVMQIQAKWVLDNLGQCSHLAIDIVQSQ